MLTPADQLRSLVKEARRTVAVFDADGRLLPLYALAPQLAELVTDMAEALEPFVENAAPHEQLFSGEDLRNFQSVESVLARLAALFPEDSA